MLYIAKISGKSSENARTHSRTPFTKGIGSPKYMAPEILNRQHYKKPSDVYSFAITMIEVMIWGEAYPRSLYKFAWNISDAVANGQRPGTIEDVRNRNIRKIIESSWNQELKERLTINDVVAMLETAFLKSK